MKLVFELVDAIGELFPKACVGTGGIVVLTGKKYIPGGLKPVWEL